MPATGELSHFSFIHVQYCLGKNFFTFAMTFHSICRSKLCFWTWTSAPSLFQYLDWSLCLHKLYSILLSSSSYFLFLAPFAIPSTIGFVVEDCQRWLWVTRRLETVFVKIMFLYCLPVDVKYVISRLMSTCCRHSFFCYSWFWC